MGVSLILAYFQTFLSFCVFDDFFRFSNLGFWVYLGPPYCGICATIRIGREMPCLPYAGFLKTNSNFYRKFPSIPSLPFLPHPICSLLPLVIPLTENLIGTERFSAGHQNYNISGMFSKNFLQKVRNSSGPTEPYNILMTNKTNIVEEAPLQFQDLVASMRYIDQPQICLNPPKKIASCCQTNFCHFSKGTKRRF